MTHQSRGHLGCHVDGVHRNSGRPRPRGPLSRLFIWGGGRAMGHLQSPLCLPVSTTLLCGPRGFLLERICLTSSVCCHSGEKKKKNHTHTDTQKEKKWRTLFRRCLAPALKMLSALTNFHPTSPIRRRPPHLRSRI